MTRRFVVVVVAALVSAVAVGVHARGVGVLSFFV